MYMHDIYNADNTAEDTRDPFRWAAVEFNGRSYTCLYTFLGLYLPTYLPINNAIVFIILCASASSSTLEECIRLQ